MIRFIMFIYLTLIAATVMVLFFCWRLWQKHQEREKNRRLSAFRLYRQRLQFIVSELLHELNDLDQGSKYLDYSLNSDWSPRLALLCQDLVRLGDTVSMIDDLLKAEDVKRSGRALLLACQSAGKASRELKTLRQQALPQSFDKLEKPRRNDTCENQIDRQEN